MPSINMIATRRAERRKLEGQVRMAALVVLCLLIAGFGLMSFMTARIYATDRTIHQLDKKLTSVQPTVKKIAEYESETKKLEPKLQLLADSREKTLLWYTIMQNLSRSMPASTWLSEISTDRGKPTQSTSKQPAVAPEVRVTLRGSSASQMLVGEAMLRLDQCPEFQRVDLTFTQQGGSDAQHTVDFEIAALLADNGAKGGDSRNGSH